MLAASRRRSPPRSDSSHAIERGRRWSSGGRPVLAGGVRLRVRVRSGPGPVQRHLRSRRAWLLVVKRRHAARPSQRGRQRRVALHVRASRGLDPGHSRQTVETDTRRSLDRRVWCSCRSVLVETSRWRICTAGTDGLRRRNRHRLERGVRARTLIPSTGTVAPTAAAAATTAFVAATFAASVSYLMLTPPCVHVSRDHLMLLTRLLVTYGSRGRANTAVSAIGGVRRWRG